MLIKDHPLGKHNLVAKYTMENCSKTFHAVTADGFMRKYDLIAGTH